VQAIQWSACVIVGRKGVGLNVGKAICEGLGADDHVKLNGGGYPFPPHTVHNNTLLCYTVYTSIGIGIGYW